MDTLTPNLVSPESLIPRNETDEDPEVKKLGEKSGDREEKEK